MTEEITPLHEEVSVEDSTPKRKKRARGFSVSPEPVVEDVEIALASEPEPQPEPQPEPEPTPAVEEPQPAAEEPAQNFGFVVPVRAVVGRKNTDAKRGVKRAGRLSR